MNDSWVKKKLEELFDVQSSKRVHKADWKPNGVPFYRAREVVKLSQNGFVDNELFISEELFNEFTKDKGAPKKDDIIISAVGTLGQCYLVQEGDKFYIKDASVLWFSKISNVNSRYIEYAFKSKVVQDQVMDKSMGATVGTLTISRAKNIEIPIPPLQEQQQIVAILDEAFAAIDQAKSNIEKNIQNAKELFQSKLNAIFSQKGDGWEIKSLGELATFRNGMNFSKKGKGDIIKIVGVRDFQDSFYVPNESLSNVILDGAINDIDVLKDGDIVAVRSNGNPQLIGRTLLAKNIEGKVCHSGFTIRIRLTSSKIEPEYLCQFLKIQETRKKLVESGNGVGIKSLNQGALSCLLIPFPKSLEEQLKIKLNLDFLSEETKKLEVIYQNKLDDLDELKKSILQKAFSGELTNKSVIA